MATGLPGCARVSQGSSALQAPRIMAPPGSRRATALEMRPIVTSAGGGAPTRRDSPHILRRARPSPGVSALCFPVGRMQRRRVVEATRPGALSAHVRLSAHGGLVVKIPQRYPKIASSRFRDCHASHDTHHGAPPRARGGLPAADEFAVRGTPARGDDGDPGRAEARRRARRAASPLGEERQRAATLWAFLEAQAPVPLGGPRLSLDPFLQVPGDR